jgi:hypothetical protein
MCSLRLSPSTGITFLLTNWCFLIIQHQFEGGYQWQTLWTRITEIMAAIMRFILP